MLAAVERSRPVGYGSPALMCDMRIPHSSSACRAPQLKPRTRVVDRAESTTNHRIALAGALKGETSVKS